MVRRIGAIPLAVSLVVATASMFWFAYRATRAWQASTKVAAEVRERNLLMVVASGLERDMKGAQARLLLPFNRAILNMSLPHDLADRFAGGFARYPYVESFFVWTTTADGEQTTYVFNRADRPPAWDTRHGDQDRYPVLIRRDPPAIAPIVDAVRAHAASGTPFVTFERPIAGVACQTVAQLLYAGDVGVRLVAAVGLTVNLEWVRTRYFPDFIRDMRAIINDPALDIEILDDRRASVAATGGAIGPAAPSRPFPLLFADPVVTHTSRGERWPEWSVRAVVHDASAPAAAGLSASRTLALLAVTGLVAVVALALTLWAARAADKLATLQSEFVSAMSHEMKTPLSLITLASDTLASGRYQSLATIREYGEMLANEARQLRRLVDNVLCYARLHESSGRAITESVDLLDLVEESVDRFRPQLDALGFDAQLQLPLELPAFRADRIMLQHAIDNLIDNAVRHGEAGRHLGVTVDGDGAWIRVRIADRGPGIPAEEVPHIFTKFFRGAAARHAGSGLGLAIVQRIVHAHGGRIEVTTAVGQGTTVEIALPAAAAEKAGTAA